jgi:hypothetical protein
VDPPALNILLRAGGPPSSVDGGIHAAFSSPWSVRTTAKRGVFYPIEEGAGNREAAGSKGEASPPHLNFTFETASLVYRGKGFHRRRCTELKREAPEMRPNYMEKSLYGELPAGLPAS